ncbi:MAG TPA: DinB family protein [Gemmatales bacterium]|nr:DinB family protein [Gemmatales bacterium]
MSFILEHSLEVLQRTPAVLHSLLQGLSDFWGMSNYGPETFSPFDVVGHLIHGEETDWMVRAHIILEQGEAQPLPPFDRYAMFEASRGKTMADLLATFAQLREKNLSNLRALKLTPEQLNQRGTHPALGTVTLKQLLATWVAHDLNHIHQIAKAMAYQYRNEVGPWREYLTFLPRD